MRREDRRARRTAWHRSAGGESVRRSGSGERDKTMRNVLHPPGVQPIQTGGGSRPVHRQEEGSAWNEPRGLRGSFVGFSTDCEALLCAPRPVG